LNNKEQAGSARGYAYIAYSRAKIPMLFQGISGIFAVFENIYLFHNFSSNP